MRAAHALRGRQRRVTTVSDLAALDEAFVEAAEAFTRSEVEGLAKLASIRMAPPAGFPADPFSPEYRDAQEALYRRISGRDTYRAADAEVSAVTADAPPRLLYPYSTQSATAVGGQLQAAGWLLEHLPIRSPGRVVEFGPGWGLLTTQLALSGHDVTAVDINPAMLEVVQRQAGRQEIVVSTAVADMVDYSPPEPVDAFVFFESFHHTFEFEAMLERLAARLAPGGVVALLAEPIGPLPYPWGVRLDGLSLWSVRRDGWCELGFSDRFFGELLDRCGWRQERVRSRASRLTDLRILRPVGASGRR